MDRGRKIYLAYKVIRKRKSHIEALIDLTKLYNMTIFEAIAFVKDAREKYN